MLLKTAFLKTAPPLLMLCAWLAGCGCGASHALPDGSMDGSTDSGPDAARDSGRDASRDARPDATRDARVDAARDTGVDAGLDSDWLGCDPGWTPMPGLDADLTVYYATDPGCLLPISWSSCGPGCQVMIGDPRFQRSITPGMGWSDGERHLFTVVGGPAHVTHLDQPAITVVASAEGEVFGGWRGSAFGDRTRLARVGAVGGGNGWLGFAMPAHRATPDGNYATYDQRLYHAPLHALRGPLDPIVRLAPPVFAVGNVPQCVVASDTTWAAEVQPRGQVLVVEHGVAHWLGGPGSATPASPQNPFVIGHDVYWMDFFESYPGVRIAHGIWGTESEVFYDLPGVDLVAPASDGHDFAWVQGYDYDYLGGTGYSHMELWTAPYTNDKSVLTPRKAADFIGGGGDGVLAQGLYVGRHSLAHPYRFFVDVYSLVDGSRREWQVPEGWAIRGEVLWVTGDEVAYSARLSIRGQPTVIRLSIADAFTLMP